MPATFAYWNVAGLAEPSRLLLEYLGTPYEDKRYEFGSTPETFRESWLKEKFTLNLDFPNLPYYIDGDIRVTQSSAILRYLARKHDLLGATEHDRIRTDVSEQQGIDLRIALAMVVFSPDYEEAKKKFLEELPDKLRALDAFLGGKYDWFGGSSISLADFLLYSVLRFIRLFERHSLDTFEHLKAFVERFEALPRISEYIKEDKFRKLPLYAPVAKWGNVVVDD